MTAEALYGPGVAWRDSGAAAGAVRDHRCGAAGMQSYLIMLAIPLFIFALFGPVFEYIL